MDRFSNTIYNIFIYKYLFNFIRKTIPTIQRNCVSLDTPTLTLWEGWAKTIPKPSLNYPIKFNDYPIKLKNYPIK